jgi:hypothetical protein
MDAESVWAFEKATDHARARLSGDLIPATDFYQVLNLLLAHILMHARAVRVESGSILSHRVMKVHLCDSWAWHAAQSQLWIK